MKNLLSSNYYDESYFNWQKSSGEFAGWIDVLKFKSFIKLQDNVIDFGCGGGYILKNINCAEKIGIEINEAAVKTAEKVNNLIVHKEIDKIQDNWADVIISNHALEHTLQPYETLKLLHKKLKSNGLIVFYVPFESIRCSYTKNDINNHIFTWSPLNLGNLFKEAGFCVLECKAYLHKWPPRSKTLAKVGKPIFNIFCYIYGFFSRSKLSQIRIIAKKE